MNNAYSLAEVEQEISDHYHWFAQNAPGVWPREEGRLGALWGLFDLLIEEENTIGENA